MAKNGAYIVCEIPEPAVHVSYCRCRLEVSYWVRKKHTKASNQADSCLLTKNKQSKQLTKFLKELTKHNQRKINQVIQFLTGLEN